MLAQVRAQGGIPLDPRWRAFFEPKLGSDLEAVRIHDGPMAAGTAERLGARAYAVGNDVVFAQGQYRPDTHSGRRLLAHELFHAIQSRGDARALHRQPSRTHQVTGGDTLYSIARRYGVSVRDVQEANGLGASTTIAAGQTLVIPGHVPSSSELNHVVSAGETLHGIARAYGVSVAEIRHANGLGPNDVIREGQTLLIRRSTPPDTVGSTPPTTRSPTRTHTVATGETLYGIARAYGVSVAEIQAANALDARTAIEPGQSLVIPDTPIDRRDALLTPTDYETLQRQGIDVRPPSRPAAQSRIFVLHDTGGSLSVDAHAGERGPIGLGVFTWVPRTGQPVQGRPEPFERRRPTATSTERGDDIISRRDREPVMRLVWQATREPVRRAALREASLGLDLTTAERRREHEAAIAQLTAPTTARTGSDCPRGWICSTAIWTIQNICRRADTGSAEAIAAPGRAGDLERACTLLRPWFAARTERIPRATHLEMAQTIGQPQERGESAECRERSRSSRCWVCDPANPFLLPLLPYTNTQMRHAAQAYLRVAAMTGRYPFVTTHFWEDRVLTGHCDPRCFDLGRFYDVVAATVRHPAGSRYGLVPNYGTTHGTHNIWWLDRVCGRPHP